MKTIKQAVENIQNYIKEFDGVEIDYDALYEAIEDEVLNSVDKLLTDDEAKKIMSNQNQEGFIDSFLDEKYGKEYEILLTSLEQDMISGFLEGLESGEK